MSTQDPLQNDELRDSLPELPFEPRHPAPPEHLCTAIRQRVRQDLCPVRCLSKTRRVALSAVLIGFVIAVLALVSPTETVGQFTRNALLGAAGWALVTVFVLMAGVAQSTARARPVQVALTLGLPVLFLAFLAVSHTNWLSFGEFFSHAGRREGAFYCGLVALALGATAAGGVLYVWRRTDPWNPGWSGALAGLVGGLAGALSVGLVCPGREGWHLWIGHGLSVLALALLGASVGRRVLSP